MKSKIKYLFSAVICSAISFFLAYPDIGHAIILQIIAICGLTWEIYSMNVRKKWYCGSANFVDENRKINIESMPMKKPLMALYILGVLYFTFGRLIEA